jgi:LysM repeat protein
MVYLVALAGIVAITMFGLGGISARFGGNTQPPASVQSTQDSQQPAVEPDSLSVAPQTNQGQLLPNITLPGNVLDGGILPTPTPTPMPSLPPLPTLAPQPTLPVPSGNPPDTGQVTPQLFTPIQAQGGTITGEASTPFYVVQPGDTLSEIAQRLGVDVDGLDSVNNLVDDTIYPGQVLYLPLGGGGLAQPPAEAQPPQQPSETQGGQGGGTTGSVEAHPTPAGADLPQVPEMPNTGINKKR